MTISSTAPASDVADALRRTFAPRLPSINAKTVTELRERDGLTQAVMARVLGISTSTLSTWERGLVHPSGAAERLLQMVQVHGIAALLADVGGSHE